jgi:hypothetical protein
MTIQNKRLIGIVIAVAFLLLVPLIARAPWSRFDFILVGVLLLATGLMIEIVLRAVKNTKHRIAICAAILAAFFIIWVELAVGIFGTPFAGN